jgi:hypothetical protein
MAIDLEVRIDGNAPLADAGAMNENIDPAKPIVYGSNCLRKFGRMKHIDGNHHVLLGICAV